MWTYITLYIGDIIMFSAYTNVIKVIIIIIIIIIIFFNKRWQNAAVNTLEIQNKQWLKWLCVAGGAQDEAPKSPRTRRRRRRGGEEWGGGIPLPIRLGGLGERRELPQRGPGRSPGRKWIWCILPVIETFWWKENSICLSITILA